jgi:hypothetical protein
MGGGNYHIACRMASFYRKGECWVVGGGIVEWHLLDGSRSFAGSEELDENDPNVCEWLLEVRVTWRRAW